MSKQPNNITLEQVASAITTWQDFWESPKALTEKNANSWLKIYHAAVNESENLRWYWEDACNVITTRCRFFPYPVDLINVANELRKQRCAEHVSPDGTPRLVL